MILKEIWCSMWGKKQGFYFSEPCDRRRGTTTAGHQAYQGVETICTFKPLQCRVQSKRAVVQLLAITGASASQEIPAEVQYRTESFSEPLGTEWMTAISKDFILWLCSKLHQNWNTSNHLGRKIPCLLWLFVYCSHLFLYKSK